MGSSGNQTPHWSGQTPMVSLEYLGSLVLTALDIVVSFAGRYPNRFGCDIHCTPSPTNNLGVCTNK